MHPVERHLRNIGFYIITLAGTLLSLVSIIVVLELRGPASIPAEISVTALRQSLDTVQAISRTHHAGVIPTADTTMEKAAAADTAVRGRTLRGLYASHRVAVETWNTHRTALLAGQGEAAAAVAVSYGVDSGRTGYRDRERRFLELRDWYRTQLRGPEAALDSARAELIGAYVALTSLRDARTPKDAEVREGEARGHLSAAEKRLAGVNAFGPIPPREPDTKVFGGGWPHPIAALSDWLRTQRSLELASVIGMLGFGLLGAAASTVVRKRRAEDAAPDVIGDNLTNLLLSGVSAALATYLAVKGSLAVVSAEGAEPNPYVLLLTCFVAAVYWEEAWERVRKAVSGEDEDGNEPDQGDGEQQNQAGNPPQEPAKVKVPGEIVSDADTPTQPADPANPAQPADPATAVG
jgi:hypothetical protein